MKKFVIWGGGILIICIAMISADKNLSFGGSDTETNAYDELIRLIHDTRQTLIIGHLVLSELPASFDLNPRLTLMRQKPQWPFHLYKDPSIKISRYSYQTDQIVVEVIPSINIFWKARLHVIWQRMDPVTWRIERDSEGRTLSSKKRSDLSIVLLNREGQEVSDVLNDWVLLIALSGKKGVICWNSQENDMIIAPYTEGFRRFRIHGPVDSHGWRLLEPLIPKDNGS